MMPVFPDPETALPGECRIWQVGGLSVTSRGAGSGPLVMCLHGFPDNAGSFRHQMPALVAAGYRVECPLLPGYEPGSQLPDGRYDLDAVSAVLLALLDQMRPGEKVHLVGHDWGALTALVMAARAPHRFASVTSLTLPWGLSLPAVLSRAPRYLLHARYIQLFQIPGLAEWVLERRNWQFVADLIRRWSPGWRMPEPVLADIRRTLSQPGVKAAALAYYRAIYGTWRGAYRARAWLHGTLRVPALMVEGTRDGCIHPSLWTLLNPDDFAAGMKHVRLPAGHFLHQEVPGHFNPVLLDWLHRHALT